MTDGQVVLLALKMHHGSCRIVNLSSTLCQQALKSALPLCPLCQLSSGQEMRFLAIRQSDFLWSSVSSSLFSSEKLVCSLAPSAAGSVRQGKLWHPQSANVRSFSGDFPRFMKVLASSVTLCDQLRFSELRGCQAQTYRVLQGMRKRGERERPTL